MELLQQIKKWRRELHQIPELGLKEYKTTAYLKQEITKMGYSYDQILETGVFVYLDYNNDSTIAFRSDIDALKIIEKNDVAYKSAHTDCMHACGHDGHMATLLALAYYLKDVKSLKKNVLLIFQPAEESPGAARLLMEAGIKDKYHITKVYGMHVMPMIEEGMIACKAGPLMAECGELHVTIHGVDSHAGLYDQGIDSIQVAALLISQYHQILTRKIDPLEHGVLHIGTIEGGSTSNSVASKVTMAGTVRAFNDDVFYQIVTQMKRINKGLEEAYGVRIDFECERMYYAVINDDVVYREFKELGIENYLELDKPQMTGEDFSFYQREIPGVFFFLGTKTNQFSSGLHTDTFNFNEEVLLKALEVYTKIISIYK